MKKTKTKILTVLVLILLAGIYYYVKLPAINIHADGFWMFLLVVIAAVAVFYIGRRRLFRKEDIKASGIAKGLIGLFLLVVAVYLAGTLLTSRSFLLIRSRFSTGILRPCLETGRWEAWWIWYPSLRWMSSTVRSITRISRCGYPRFAMPM